MFSQKIEKVEPEEKSEREEMLEEVRGKKALKWVKEHNQFTTTFFTREPKFEASKKTILDLLEHEDNIALPSIHNGFVFEHTQVEDKPLTRWTRTTFADFRKEGPNRETILDLNSLSDDKECRALINSDLHPTKDENWNLEDVCRLEPKCSRAMLKLSLGGVDPAIYREFDINQKQFVKNGFALAESNAEVNWFDKDTLWVNSKVDGNYVRVALWKRGQPLEKAKEVFVGPSTDLRSRGQTVYRPEARYDIVSRRLSFHKSKIYIYDPKLETLRLVPVPTTSKFEVPFNHQLLFTLRDDWQVPNGPIYKPGSLIAIDLASLSDPKHLKTSLIFAPSLVSHIEYVTSTKNTVLVNVLTNVYGEIRKYQYADGKWNYTKLPLPEKGHVNVINTEPTHDNCLLIYEDYLTPIKLYYYYSQNNKLEVLKNDYSSFASDQFETNQYFATSKDGTKVPYFVTHRKNLAFNNANPTLLHGYGGFGDPELPAYLPAVGKCWLEKGGVYVDANIRGGGEYGAKWHLSAVQTKRQKSYDDFIAVAEDLIQRKITSPKHLGISGTSNGGLLVGAVITQRPDLFNAAICGQPVLDLLNYRDLDGDSWIDEYGDPQDPKMHAALKRQSPYEQVYKSKEYPPVFFMTATNDDRVHPAHARKMADKMESQGHPVFFYESKQGGHVHSADLKDDAFKEALKFAYLEKRLFGPG